MIIGGKRFLLHEDMNRLDAVKAHNKRYKYIISGSLLSFIHIFTFDIKKILFDKT